jgi:hypothetical protein
MIRSPGGPAIDSILEFMRDENVWLNSYLESWDIATTNGYRSSDLLQIGQGGSSFTISDLYDIFGEDFAFSMTVISIASSSITLLFI